MDQGKPSDSNSRKQLHHDDAHLPREKLPSDLQKLVDNDDSLVDQLYDGS